MTEIDGWVTTAEAKTITGVSRHMLYIYRLSGRVRWQKFANAVMYWREDLEKVVRERAAKDDRSRADHE